MQLWPCIWQCQGDRRATSAESRFWDFLVWRFCCLSKVSRFELLFHLTRSVTPSTLREETSYLASRGEKTEPRRCKLRPAVASSWFRWSFPEWREVLWCKPQCNCQHKRSAHQLPDRFREEARVTAYPEWTSCFRARVKLWSGSGPGADGNVGYEVAIRPTVCPGWEEERAVYDQYRGENEVVPTNSHWTVHKPMLELGPLSLSVRIFVLQAWESRKHKQLVWCCRRLDVAEERRLNRRMKHLQKLLAPRLGNSVPGPGLNPRHLWLSEKLVLEESPTSRCSSWIGDFWAVPSALRIFSDVGERDDSRALNSVSGNAVTSAPVSILNFVGVSFTLISIIHGSVNDWSPSSPRNTAGASSVVKSPRDFVWQRRV